MDKTQEDQGLKNVVLICNQDVLGSSPSAGTSFSAAPRFGAAERPTSYPTEYVVVEPARDRRAMFIVARRMAGGRAYVEFARTASRFAADRIAAALNEGGAHDEVTREAGR